jgi:peroxiredoxin (alkyl hydroperoxide reductase subunit C)
VRKNCSDDKKNTFLRSVRQGGGITEATDKSLIKINDHAPDFTLPTHNEGQLNLAWYEGRKNVVLAFYPGDWTPVCSNQIPAYQQVIDRFEEYDCQLLAISCDSIPCHIAWAKSLGGLSFPLMSDFYPHGKVARLYGVFNERRGYSERSIFLIDKKGIVRYIEHLELSQLPDNEKLFGQLAKLEN